MIDKATRAFLLKISGKSAQVGTVAVLGLI
jgi:hypothetical protein